MDDSEYADILGRSTLPQRHVPKSSLPFAIKTAFALGLFLALYVVATYAWDALLRWRELNYKMSVRRKHGIPDSDRRPFNVAHAAVTVARQDREREAANRRFEQNLRDQRAEQNIRQRPAQQSQIGFIRQNHSISSRFPGSFSNAAESSRPTSLVSTSYPSHSAQPNRVTFADDYTTPNPVAEATGPSRRPKKGISILKTSSKRALDDDEEVDQSKKSRVDGEEFIDGDEDAEWQKNRASHGPNRVSKRQLIDGDSEDFIASKRTKDNRTQGPLDDSTLSDDDMEVDDEMAPVSVRGQKRHRTENGSPVGSVDDAEQPEEVDGQSRRRKRRNKRRSDVGVTSRGQKRDRDAEQSSSEENEAPKLSRKKRGKKSQVASQEEPDDEKASDISMDDASPRGRKVGETWESNGVEYKLGPDGVRLRKCLMRKDQPKFNMPKDSLHPDRDGRIVVHIESWLTETEYQEAKAKGLFNHQDEGKVPETPPPVVKEKPSPVKPSGKHLLWDATGPSYLTSAKNPFDGSPRAVRKFIPDAHLAAMTSPHRIASALLTDSTNGSLRQYQQYTKWEKQDLEAKAMMKVRQAKNNREKEKEEKEKAASASLIPSISLTKPAEDNLFKKPDAQPPPFGADMFKKPAPAASPLGAGGDFFKSTPAPSALGQDSSKKPSLADAPPLGAVANVAPSSGAASGPSPSLFPAFSPAPAAAPIQAPAQPQQAPASTFAFNSGQNANNMFAQKAAEKPSLSSAGFPSNFNPTPPAVQPTQPAAAAKPMSAFTSAPAGNLFGPPKPNPAPNPASVSSFQFPPSNSASGPSLLGRISTPTAPEAPKVNPFAPAAAAPASGSAPAPASTQQNATQPLKFNFGVSAGAARNVTPSSLSGALTPNPPASNPAPAALAPSQFSFNVPKVATAATATPGSTTPAGSPAKFSFGTSAAPSTSAFGTSGNTAAFSGFTSTGANAFGTSNPAAGGNAFGTSNSTPGTNPFGSSSPTAGGNPFGSSSQTAGGNAFGAKTDAAKPAASGSTFGAMPDASKPAVSSPFGATSAFGSAPSTFGSSFGAAKEVPKTTFGTGSTNAFSSFGAAASDASNTTGAATAPKPGLFPTSTPQGSPAAFGFVAGTSNFSGFGSEQKS